MPAVRTGRGRRSTSRVESPLPDRAFGRGSWSEFLDLSIDTSSDRPIYAQIYLRLREAIVAGALAPGTRLPSSRRLADRLGVSRMSAIAAYEQLTAEGYAGGRRGSGTY